MPSDRVALRILGTDFTLDSEDGRWVALMRELWAPFVVESPAKSALRVEVVAKGGAWRADLFGQRLVTDPDPWNLAAHVRIGLFQRAQLEASGIVPLHAGVVEREGMALLIVGPGGTGKTSLVLELLGRGWSYFSDDLAPLDVRTGAVLAMPKPLHVKDVLRWPACRRMWEPPDWLPAPSTSFLVPPTVFGCDLFRRARPRWLIFPRFDLAGVRGLEELTPARAAALCAQNTHDPAPSTVAALSRVCRGARARSITYASSDDALAEISAMLDE